MRQPSKFGKYLLLERIAVGGMAEVFVAKAFGVEGFERLLAIKKILPTMGEDPEFQTMFVDEARIAAQLAHANIVQVLELGKHDDNLFIAMEYISGRDVRQLLERFRKRGKPMPVPQACTIVGKVCEALDYAHRKRDTSGRPLGIVHRDVSPQNVLVSFEGDVKLIDFGIAKAESRLQRTQAGILKGKFSYMSPEQVRGLSIDHRSDVFAVGVLLWELLCGEKLFTGDSDFAVLEKVRKGDVPPPRKFNPEVPEALEKVVLKALAAEVADRYQWASELHDALTRFTLLGDIVYGARQLAEWMREEFHAEFDKEQARLRGWLGVSEDEGEVTPSDPIRRHPQASYGGELQVPAPTARPPVDSQELPTMKMDGEALAAAERDLYARRAAEGRPLALPADDEESTESDPGKQRPVDASRATTMPEGHRAPRRAGAEGQPPPRLLDEVSILSEPTQPLPVQPLAFDVSDDPTAAPRSQRRQGLTRAARESEKVPAAPPARTLRSLILGFVSLGLAVAAAWALWPSEHAAQGKLVVTVSPSLPAELMLDGKPAGALPPFVRTVPVGLHRVEVRAPGFKPFTTAVTVTSAARPLEVQAALTADGPMQVDGVMLSQPAPQEAPPATTEVVPREPTRRWLLGPAKSTPAASPSRIAAPEKPAPGPPQRRAIDPEGTMPIDLEAPAPSTVASLAPQAAGTPSLRVSTVPSNAEVIVDGRPVGKSPAMIKDLDAIKVHMVLATLDGYAPARRAVKLDEGKPTELDLTLAPALATKPDPYEAAPAEPQPSGPVGYLVAMTKPVARVSIDGHDSGRWTPVAPKNPITLSIGSHLVVFETMTGKKHEERIEIEAGKTAKLIRLDL